jgi:hypothetical protein
MNDARRSVFVTREEVRKEPEGSIVCVIIHCSLELVESLCMYKDDYHLHNSPRYANIIVGQFCIVSTT